MSLINEFIRNVRCGYFSLTQSFRAQAGRSDNPGGLFAFKFVNSCLPPLSVTNRKQNFRLRYFLILVFLIVGSTTFFSQKNIRV